jgi:glycine/D-amino acid oxidase-like deaminating enzyme
MNSTAEAVVIGGGVVGSAIAYGLAKRGHDTG